MSDKLPAVEVDREALGRARKSTWVGFVFTILWIAGYLFVLWANIGSKVAASLLDYLAVYVYALFTVLNFRQFILGLIDAGDIKRGQSVDRFERYPTYKP